MAGHRVIDEQFTTAQSQAWARYREMSQGAESVNGRGSWLRNTAAVRGWLPQVLAEYRITSILDVPCGDGNWMSHVNLGEVRYLGWDVEADNVVEARNRFSRAGLAAKFECINILTVDQVPTIDLIFCRDFLQHLPNEAISHVLEKFTASNSRYLITNNYRAPNDVDCPLAGGHQGAVTATGPLPGYYYRPVNLEAPPFNLTGRNAALHEPGLPGEQYAEITQELVLFDLISGRESGKSGGP